MNVELTPEQYGTVWRALVKIAAGRREPNHKRISRDEMVMVAREACESVGWKYDAAATKSAYR
jgi:hypothetical protein